MSKTIISRLIAILMPVILLLGCKDFLDERSDQRLNVPTTLADFQALMNELNVMQVSPPDGELVSDDLYIADEQLGSLGCSYDLDLYYWRDGPMSEMCYGKDGWTSAYDAIYIANAVLEGLENFSGVHDSEYYDLIGQAHFNRGLLLLELAIIWTDAYDNQQALEQLGLPLRLSTDFNQVSTRANLKITFDQILEDLYIALDHLPYTVSSKMRPSKDAVRAVLARTYLWMGNFSKAQEYAEYYLDGKELIDYNSVSAEVAFPFDRTNNKEIIYERCLFGYLSLFPGFYAHVNPSLYDLYQNEDTRKESFFIIEDNKLITYKGNYGGGSLVNFSGIATDEMYLTLAECSYRLGETEKAKDLLTHFVKHRYREGFDPYNGHNILTAILLERRKQLIFRGLRFGDIKRLNKLGANISLKRIIDKQEYSLPANDHRFTLLIPSYVIQLSGMKQNMR